MRQYLLDSAPLAAYLNGRQVAVDLISPWIARREAATSILVYGEITEYLKGLSHFSRRHAQLRRLLREVYPYFLTYAIMDRYADIRHVRPRTGLRSPWRWRSAAAPRRSPRPPRAGCRRPGRTCPSASPTPCPASAPLCR